LRVSLSVTSKGEPNASEQSEWQGRKGGDPWGRGPSDEIGIVLYLGKPDRQEPPGLHYRLPYPVEEVYLPKVTRQNIIEIGMRSGEPARRVLEVLPESLILTGDENIVDIHFVVFWRIGDRLP
jgi:regulator of protease activity HflC (stomatin/prohibitin superfamily)